MFLIILLILPPSRQTTIESLLSHISVPNRSIGFGSGHLRVSAAISTRTIVSTHQISVDVLSASPKYDSSIAPYAQHDWMGIGQQIPDRRTPAGGWPVSEGRAASQRKLGRAKK
jgi:hypothetical protein